MSLLSNKLAPQHGNVTVTTSVKISQHQLRKHHYKFCFQEFIYLGKVIPGNLCGKGAKVFAIAENSTCFGRSKYGIDKSADFFVKSKKVKNSLLFGLSTMYEWPHWLKWTADAEKIHILNEIIARGLLYIQYSIKSFCMLVRTLKCC